MNYRDLTGDDVLQDGDEAGCANVWGALPDFWIGCRCYEFPGWEFRRPLTPAEITAANRVKFEAWCRCDPVVLWNLDRFQDGHAKGNYCDTTVRYMFDAWCQAVNCDPMGDVTTD